MLNKLITYRAIFYIAYIDPSSCFWRKIFASICM